MKQFTFIKKAISLLLSMLLLLLSSSVITYATNITFDKSSVVSFTEAQAMKSAMETRGIGGDISIEILHDSNNKPSFLLGVSDSGYQIIARETLMCIEGGEANPYASYPEGKKVYGGFLNFVKIWPVLKKISLGDRNTFKEDIVLCQQKLIIRFLRSEKTKLVLAQLVLSSNVLSTVIT